MPVSITHKYILKCSIEMSTSDVLHRLEVEVTMSACDIPKIVSMLTCHCNLKKSVNVNYEKDCSKKTVKRSKIFSKINVR